MELKKGPRVGGWTSLLIAHASLAWLPLETERGRSAISPDRVVIEETGGL